MIYNWTFIDRKILLFEIWHPYNVSRIIELRKEPTGKVIGYFHGILARILMSRAGDRSSGAQLIYRGIHISEGS